MKIISFVFAVLLSAGVSAQNVKDYIKSAPSSVFQYIDSLSRADMFDKGASGIFGDSIIMHKSNGQFVSFSVSNLDVQVRLADDIIIVCSTYAGQNSKIDFYETDWQLKGSWIYGSAHCKKMPSDKRILEETLVKPEDMSDERFERLKLYFDPMLVRAELMENDNSVTLVPVAPMLTEDEKTELKAVIKQKTFKWINGKFK